MIRLGSMVSLGTSFAFACLHCEPVVCQDDKAMRMRMRKRTTSNEDLPDTSSELPPL